MAPSSPSALFSRQFGEPPDDNDHDFLDDDHRRFSSAAIVGIIIAAVVLVLSISYGVLTYLRWRRRSNTLKTFSSPHHQQQQQQQQQHGSPNILLQSQQQHPLTKTNTPAYLNLPGKSNVYGGSNGYQATPDQNHSLLGHAEAPAIIVTWNATADRDGDDDCAGISSTQNGFGYTGAGAGAIQRPPGIAITGSFGQGDPADEGAPPPRYEEVAGLTSMGARPPSGAGDGDGGISSTSTEQQRGRSRARASSSSLVVRERSASESDSGNGNQQHTSTASVGSDDANTASAASASTWNRRSVNGDRRRSVSRFREVGMVDLDLDQNQNREARN